MMTLLGPEALNGTHLAISASDSADLARLGLLESHFRFALGEILRSILVAGGEASYGGYIDTDGYGSFLASELQRFARRDRPFHAVLPLSEHRRKSVSELKTFADGLGLYGDLTCLDVTGNVVAKPYEGRTEEAAPIDEEKDIKAGLTAMRYAMAGQTDARVLIGGKKNGFKGDLPGVVEEFLIAAEMGKPVYLAGGFGGATYDLAVSTVLDGKEWMPEGDAVDDRYSPVLETLRKLPKEVVERLNDNGLDADERQRLAVTHRASEIAALISLGLGRKFGKK